MMLSMWKGYQYDVVYVERIPVSCCLCGKVASIMLSTWKVTNMMLSMWKGYQYDVVYLEMLPV